MMTSYRLPWKYNRIPVSPRTKAQPAKIMKRFIRRTCSSVTEDTEGVTTAKNSGGRRIYRKDRKERRDTERGEDRSLSMFLAGNVIPTKLWADPFPDVRNS